MEGLDGVFDLFDPGSPFEKYRSESRPHSTSAESSAQAEINKLQNDVERLLLISEALWKILKEQHGYTNDLLQRRILEIDGADGKIDGHKASSPPRKCPECSRVVAKNATRCMWCGTLAPGDPFGR